MNFLNYICLVLFCIYNAQAQVQKLGKYKVLKNSFTVSGISSGGSMATQLHVAFSETFSGVGVVTGPPFYCSGTGGTSTALTTCMSGNGAAINPDTAITALNGWISKNQADKTSNLANDKIYIYHGTADTTVTEGVAKKNEAFYLKFVPQKNFKTLYTIKSAHGFITNNFGGACGTANSANYINNCDYNQAYDILRHMYDLTTPEPVKNIAYKEPLIEFDQTEFYPSGTSGTITMDTSGYVYVPKSCKDGKACRVHVALHGCVQGKYKIGNVFPHNTGYNQVGDANDIIIIYPQAKSSSLSNPNGCWDWWGYINANYSNKIGPQMAAIKNMIDRLASGGIVDNVDNGNTGGSNSTCYGVDDDDEEYEYEDEDENIVADD